MNINQLKYFVSVGECRSFSKAAEQNFISQTAITQQIKALENTMGTTLVERGKRPVELTPAGRVFMQEAKAILERMELAVKRTHAAKDGLEGSIRIGYTKGYECSSFPGKLREFHKKYPNVLITCFRHDTDMLAAGLLNGEYDVIFTWDSTNILQDDRACVRLVDRVQLMAALYSSHPFAQRSILKRSELKGERLLFMSPSSNGDSLGDAHYIQLYQKAGYNPDILLRTSDMESVIMMIEAEVGISILPAYCANNRMDTNKLIFIPLEGEAEIEDIIAVWRKDDPNIVLKHFLSFFP
ncbi:MAG: LysR family transcriptional regulator [Clostridiales bacterium]|nr:LysR family transcriptional regulator [Clostridiales bacterium]